MRRTVAVLLVALTLGCASPGKTDSGEPAKAPPPKEEPAQTNPPSSDDAERAGQQAGKGEEFTPAQRAKMEVYWDAFKTESPTWPQLRDEWLLMGERAKLTLTENLLRAMILSRLSNQPRFAMMARTELIFLGADIVPLVENVLENPTFFDPGVQKVVRLPAGVQSEMNELLLINEEASVPSFIRLAKSEVPGVRRKALDSLGRLKDPRGTPILIETLQTADHWADRLTAARALGYGEDPRATSALEKALSDEDETVVIEAARGLVRQGALSALPALEARAQKAKAADEWKISRACTDAAMLIRKNDALKKADAEGSRK